MDRSHKVWYADTDCGGEHELLCHTVMPVVVSGTAGTRLSRVQRTLPSVTTFEAGVLTSEESDAALKCTLRTEKGNSDSHGSSTSCSHRSEANEPGSQGQPDPSALVLHL